MTKQERLPSDALTKRTSPIRTALIAVAAVVVIAGLSVGGVALGQTLTVHPTPTATALPADTAPAPVTADEQATIQQAADAQQAQIAADQAAQAKAAADAAAAQAAADAAAKAAATKRISTTYPMGTAPKGALVPFVKSSDPQNANGGDYIDPGLYCAAHSASTVNGVPVCD